MAKIGQNHTKTTPETEKGHQMKPKPNQKKPRRGRRRTRNQGSAPHPRKVTIRITERLSNELASIQGLMFAFGRRETLCDVWERVLMPRLRAYVRSYAERARKARAAGGAR